jgi:hypothetical protein
MTDRPRYQAFGVVFESDVEFPEHRPTDAPASVIVERGTAPETLDNPELIYPNFVATRDEFLFTWKDLGRFYARGGERVTLDLVPDADLSAVRVFLFGIVFRALLHQRDLLVFHAGAFRIGESAALIVGNSGAGKSTTMGAALRRGYRIFTDDLCAVDARETPRAIPGYGYIKLWQNTMTLLGISSEGLERVRPEFEKFRLPLGDRLADEPLPISRIYLMTPELREDLTLAPVRGADKLRIFLAHTFNSNEIQRLGGAENHFRRLTAIANGAEMREIKRPASKNSLAELFDAIERDAGV